MIAPVVMALREACPDVRADVLGLTTARGTLKREGIEFSGFRDFVDAATDTNALEIGARLMGSNHATHTSIPQDESIAYLGLNYMDLVAEQGEVEAQALYEEVGRQCFLPMGTMQRVFDRFDPDFVVTTTSPRAELAARRVARQRGIPSMAITDVLGIGRFVPDLRVDHLCVNSRTAEKNYNALPQVRAGSIHLAGNPAMDRMIREADKPKDTEWRRKIFPVGDMNASYVLVAEQFGYMRANNSSFVNFTASDIHANLDRLHAACQANNAIMLIRPHPSLTPDIYDTWIDGKRGSAFLAQSHDLARLLNACDLVVSNFSTIMLDALYANRPVLLVNYPDSGNMMPFDKMGFATGVDIEDARDLEDSMRRALADTDLFASQQALFRADYAELPCAPKIADIIAQALS